MNASIHTLGTCAQRRPARTAALTGYELWMQLDTVAWGVWVCVCVWMPCAPILSPPEGSSIRRGEDGTHPLTAPRVLPDVVADLGAGGRRRGHGRTLQVPWLAFMRSIITHTRTVQVDGWPAPPKVWFPDPKYQSSRPRPNEVGQTPPLDRACIDIQSGPEHEPGRLGRPLDEGNKSPDTRVAGMTFAATATSVVDDSRHEKHGAGKPLQQEVPPIHGAGQWRKLPK